jgi:hypothetical protein
MTRYTASKASIRQKIMRHGRWLVLGTLFILAAFAAYRAVPAPVAATSAASTAQAATHDPAMQGVLDYLRAHSPTQSAPTSAAPLDPAQQSIMRYVHAHENAGQPTTLWDQVKQTVLGYLRGNGK